MRKNSVSKLTSKASSFQVLRATWQQHRAGLSAPRRAVFIEEQKVPEALEWDGLDEMAMHALAVDAAGTPIGCGRLLPKGRIGRMAVLREWRGKGVGRALLQELLAMAREQGMPAVSLSAQVQAMPFYQQAGFAAHGAIYLDAGIPHRDMSMRLSV